MNDFMTLLVSLSLSGSAIALLLFAAKPLYQNRLSKAWQYYVWLIVLVRLLLPFAPETNLMARIFEWALPSVSTAEAAWENISQSASEYAVPAAPAIQAGEMPISESSVAAAQLRFDPIRFLEQNLLTIWFVVALVLFVRKLTGYHSFVRYIRAGKQELADTGLLDAYYQACEDAGICKPLPIYENKLAASPMLVGVLRPCIVLPELRHDTEDIRLILNHELIHYKRGDILYKWLVQLALCVHWFNPLIYLAAREIDRNCELSCDEAMLRSLTDTEKRRYGDTLLFTLKAGGSYMNAVVSVTLTEDGKNLKERLEAILAHRIRSPWTKATAVLLSIALLCGAAYAGAYAGAVREQEMPQKIVPDVEQWWYESSTKSAQQTVSETVTVPETKMVSKTVTVKPNITSGSVVLADGLNIKSLNINASVGNLTVKRGEQYKIEVGPKLADHAIYDIDYENGVLRYFDDYKGKQLEINNTNEGYDIIITIPNVNTSYDTVSIYSGFGTVSVEGISATATNVVSTFGRCNLFEIQSEILDIQADFGELNVKNSLVSGAINCTSEFGRIILDAVQAKALTIIGQQGGIDIKNSTIDGAVTCRNQMGGLTVQRSTISGGLDVSLASGGAEISSDIKGNIAIKKGIGGFNLTITGSKRSDYHIVADDASYDKNSPLSSGITIDGKRYSYNYDDSNTNAPYTMKIISSNGFGEDVSVFFGVK